MPQQLAFRGATWNGYTAPPRVKGNTRVSPANAQEAGCARESAAAQARLKSVVLREIHLDTRVVDLPRKLAGLALIRCVLVAILGDFGGRHRFDADRISAELPRVNELVE